VDEGAGPSLDAEPGIIESDRECDLDRILLPQVQAVIYRPEALPPWLHGLARAIESGAFHLDRAILSCATLDEAAVWLERMLARSALPLELRSVLSRAILDLVERQGRLTGASQFMVRVLTEAPTRRCGFHVDTALPRAPTIGLLRVFNGAQTEYAHPANVTSMRDFYRYLSQRERLAREMEQAWTRGERERHGEIGERVASLDERPDFLRHPEDVRVVPPGATVAFKHVDARLHWSNHSPALAWIHRSPMEGQPRLVVNVTAWDPEAHRVVTTR
jgi:hypothetical protein